jgi:hypothetical protein
MVSDSSNGIYRSVIAAIVGWMILVGNAQPISNRAGSDAPAAQSNQSTPNDAKVTAGINRIGNALEAQNTKIDPYEKEQNDREIRDLQAQEISAYWAGAMFWVNLGALILSAIGIGLVYITFDQARKATAVAQANLDLYRKAEAGSLTPTVKWLDDGKLHIVATYRGSGTCEIIFGDIGYFVCNDTSTIVLATKLSHSFMDKHRSIDATHPYAFPPIAFPDAPSWTVGGAVIWKDRFGGINLCCVALDVIPSSQTIFTSERLDFSRWKAAMEILREGESVTPER